MAIEIIQQPHDAVAKIGETVTFNVVAIGDGLSYQWQLSDDLGKTWRNTTADGAKTNTLTTKMTEVNFGRYFRCIITDAYKEQVISDSAKIILIENDLTIIKQPQNVQAVYGSDIKIIVKAEGDELKYIWQLSDDLGISWLNCTSSTIGYNTDTISLTLEEKHNRRRYRCIVSDVYGESIISDVSQITVYVFKFITDRQISDVEELREMTKTGWKNLSAEEKIKWLSGMKGAINYSDLNRLGGYINIANTMFYDYFEVHPITTTPAKTDWKMSDIPSKSQLQNIINNYYQLAYYMPLNLEGTDFFRMCTVDAMNRFESEVYELNKIIGTITNNGEYKNDLIWTKDKTDNLFKTERVRMGSLYMKAVIPLGATLTINQYESNQEQKPFDTLIWTARNENDRTIQFAGLNDWNFEFICDKEGVEIYTTGKM